MMATLPPQAPALNTRPHTPPVAYVGDMVLWWAHGETENHLPLPAVVVSVGTRTLNLAVFQPLRTSALVKDGVRHISDPDARRDEFVEMGAWSHTPRTEQLHQLHGSFFSDANVDTAVQAVLEGPPTHRDVIGRVTTRTPPKAEPPKAEDLEEMPKDEDDT